MLSQSVSFAASCALHSKRAARSCKNYYYLPEQNCAIHKSVAAYVDKSRRTAATKNTCYTWVEPHTLNTPSSSDMLKKLV